jgi:multisubunit Na+/H+ antiporter MnhG subunit
MVVKMEQNTDSTIEELKGRIAELEKKLLVDKDFSKQVQKIEEKPLHDIYTWTAPDRIVPRKPKSWYTIVGLISIVCIFLSILMGNFMLVFAILAIIFLIYVISTVPSQIVECAITNKGVRVQDEVFLWNDIDHFWISKRDEQLVINIELKEFKGRIIVLVGSGDVDRIVMEMVKHEDYREPKGFEAIVHKVTEGEYKKFTEFKK